ncbi:hypothetical protein [Streptomyces sp. NPDC048612]|uniref:hypothetical protein n=1 Tax=Streptomyces sp. NPDC048612 TaxID=3365579 RepID=UPI0037155F16
MDEESDVELHHVQQRRVSFQIQYFESGASGVQCLFGSGGDGLYGFRRVRMRHGLSPIGEGAAAELARSWGLSSGWRGELAAETPSRSRADADADAENDTAQSLGPDRLDRAAAAACNGATDGGVIVSDGVPQGWL